MKKTDFLNEKLCKKCGGECCQSLPGSCSPDDFDGSRKKIIDAIKSGKYAIDWWEGFDENGGNTGYFVRPATKGNKGKIYDASWGGQCTFLSSNGCDLNADERPEGCRLLEPKPDGECAVHGMGKLDAARSWIPFFDLLANMGSICNERHN